MKIRKLYTYKYYCTQLNFLNSKHNNEDKTKQQQKNFSHTLFAWQKEKGVRNQDSARGRTTVRSRERSLTSRTGLTDITV